MTSSEPTADAAPWEGERVEQWLRSIDDLDRQLSPVDGVLFAAADLAAGERVLDVGCGDGRVTRRVAVAVGESGGVVGLDVAPEMLEHAARQPVPEAAASIGWILADVSKGSGAWNPGAPFDAVVSRFGVMFFDAPNAAFAALAAATRPGGRLAVAVWRSRDESDVMRLPLEVATGVLDRHDCDYAPLANDQGPFSIHSPSVAEEILDGSGWTEVSYVAHDLPMKLSGGVPPDEAARRSLTFGPAGRRVKGQTPEIRAEVEAELTELYSDHVDGDGDVSLTAAVAVITALR